MCKGMQPEIPTTTKKYVQTVVLYLSVSFACLHLIWKQEVLLQNQDYMLLKSGYLDEKYNLEEMEMFPH